jgi:Rhodopirellula transposase DDE domain
MNYARRASPRRCKCMASRSPNLVRAAPYGIYGIAGNTGWVSVGVDHDTATFAVNAIRRW